MRSYRFSSVFPKAVSVVNHHRLMASFSESARDMLGKANFIFDD
jgi:hypothetical protein